MVRKDKEVLANVEGNQLIKINETQAILAVTNQQVTKLTKRPTNLIALEITIPTQEGYFVAM